MSPVGKSGRMRSPVSPSTKWTLWSYAPNTTHVRPSRSNTAGCPVHPLPHHVRRLAALARRSAHRRFREAPHDLRVRRAPGRGRGSCGSGCRGTSAVRRPRSPTVVRTKPDRRRGRCAARPAPVLVVSVRVRARRARRASDAAEGSDADLARLAASSSPSLPLVARMSTPMPMKPISTSVRTSRRCRRQRLGMRRFGHRATVPCARHRGGGRCDEQAQRRGLVVAVGDHRESRSVSTAPGTCPCRAAVLRVARWAAPQRAGRRDRAHANRRTATCSSPRTAACSRSVTPRSVDRSAGCV